jgi:hypothetical protein
MKFGNCPLTDCVIRSIQSGKYETYEINLCNVKFTFTACPKCMSRMKDDNSRIPTYLMKSLLINGKLNHLENKVIHWGETSADVDGIDLKNELLQITYPKTPNEVIEHLFIRLSKLQAFNGDRISLQYYNDFCCHFYCKNQSEFAFFLTSLEKIGYLHDVSLSGGGASCRITFEGLNALIKLSEEGTKSNKCFVAMSFQNETKPIRIAIKKALAETGFVPIIIDEQNISSDKTINDEIIAGIKRSKFCIADFSFHKNGVYFESGFALGQGKQVIYTCEEEQFRNAHFDIKPLQHIIYKTADELQEKLISKIEAWII